MPNLGIKQKDAYGDMPVCVGGKDNKNETVYPSFGLRDKFLEASGLGKDLTIGDKITVTLELEVCGVNGHKNKNHSSQSIDFDVITIEQTGSAKKSEEDKKAKETEVLGYERKENKKPAPKMSAKDLEK